MKRKRNLYHLWICFAMLLFLAVPFNVKAATATTPVSISVQYGQTEARTILDMINEMRTSSTDAWYWKQDDTTKTYCTNLQPLQLVLRSILVQNTPQPGMIADIQSTAEMAKIAEQLKYATIVVSSLPLLVMYPFFQKYFDKGIMVGSVKG